MSYLLNRSLSIVLMVMLATAILTCAEEGSGPFEGSNTESDVPLMGAVKVVLNDLYMPSDDYVDYRRSQIKAIILNLHKVEVKSETRGWIEAVNLVNANNPDGSYFELIGIKNQSTPELGTFQLEKDDYSRVRFYFGKKNHVIVQEATGALSNKCLEIETGDDINKGNESQHARDNAKGYRVKNSGSGNSSSSNYSNLDDIHGNNGHPDCRGYGDQNQVAGQDGGHKDEHENEGGIEDSERYIELFVTGGFYIDPDVVTEITLGVNPMASIEKHGNRYEFDPVINVKNVRTIAGASTFIRAATGGTINLENEVTIDIPPGALPKDTNIAIVPKEKPRYSQYKTEFIDMKNYTFLPHGLTMNSNATLTINYDATFIDELNKASGNSMLSEHFVDIQYFDEVDKRYKSVGRQVDMQTNTVLAYTSHFSEWTLSLNLSSALLGLSGNSPDDIPQWQDRVNNILAMAQDFNTTSISPGYSSTGPVNFNELRAKNSSGAFLYYAKEDKDPPNKVWSAGEVEVTWWEIGQSKYLPLRMKFIPDIEKMIDKNNRDYTPGYPMHPKLFMISQFADLILNENLKDDGYFLRPEIPGYASVNGLSMAFNDITLGAYLFFHAAQRHDLCDGKGGMYKKNYTQCNLDFYGNKDNPEPIPFDSNGKLPYPARFPSYYNMSSICASLSHSILRTKCKNIREDFMAAVTNSGFKNGNEMDNVCDDYEFWFRKNPETPPTNADRKWICPASGGMPSIKDILNFLVDDYPQFMGVNTVGPEGEEELPPPTNVRISKQCPAGYDAYLRLEWDLDKANWGLSNPEFFDVTDGPIPAARARYNRIKITMSRLPNDAGMNSAEFWDFVLRLAAGSVVDIPYPPNQAVDRILPYYFTMHTSHNQINHFRQNGHGYDYLYSDYWLDPLPDTLEPWPDGNYQFSIQTSIIGYPDNDTSRPPFEVPSDPAHGKYCNHEVINACLAPWGNNGKCTTENTPTP